MTRMRKTKPLSTRWAAYRACQECGAALAEPCCNQDNVEQVAPCVGRPVRTTGSLSTAERVAVEASRAEALARSWEDRAKAAEADLDSALERLGRVTAEREELLQVLERASYHRRTCTHCALSYWTTKEKTRRPPFCQAEACQRARWAESKRASVARKNKAEGLGGSI